MADTKTSDLGAAATITGAELLAIVQAGVNKQSTPDELKTYYETALATTFAQLAGLTSQAFACSNLAFPATAVPSADPNTLDDYEEGTWTPIFGGSTSESGQVHSHQNGDYVKVGSKVTCIFEVGLSTLGTITGNVYIKGLPFVSVANKRSGVALGQVNALTTAIVSAVASTEHASDFLSLSIRTAAAISATAAVQGDLSNATRVVGTVSYFIS